MCVGQQLHVVCGARLQINVGPSAQSHAWLGGGEAVPHPRPAFPSCADWLLAVLDHLAADPCSSSWTLMCWPGISAGPPCIDENWT